jgi:hypothetical protein
MKKCAMILIGMAMVGCATSEPAKSGTIRQRFVPAAAGTAARGASWSALHPSQMDSPGVWMAMARAGMGDTFPIAEDAGPTLFKVFVATGDDDHLVLEVSSTEGTQRVDLHRDRPASIQVAGRTYKLSYPSVYVAPTAKPTTTQAMLMVHRLP